MFHFCRFAIGARSVGARSVVARSIVAAISALLAALILAPCSDADDSTGWTQFRGSNGDGVTAKSLPTKWSPESNLRWRTELPGNGWSSPVTVGDRVYLTTAIPVTPDGTETRISADSPGEDDQTLALLIVDAESGRLLRQVSVMEQSSERPPKVHAKNSHASPTPIIDGNRLFVHFGYQGTACLTLDGDPLWVNRDLYFQPTHGNGGSPILVGDRLIFTCDGDQEPKVVALDANTGRLAWQVRRPVQASKTFSFCTPSAFDVDGKTQVVAPGSDCVQALDPETGETIWEFEYQGYSVVPKPVLDSGLVFLSTGFNNAKMLAIEPTGRGAVTDSHLRWQVDRNVPKTPSMIAHEGLVYSISDDGIAMCVEAETGELVYRKRIGGKFSASPLLAGDYLYFTSEQGVTTVIKAGPEFEVVAENDLEERTLASLAVVDNSNLLRTAEAIYRIGN